jgi:anti-sigma factor RsiW
LEENMSPDGAGSDRNGSDHPAELPWYVAGTLEPEKIRLVELHLNHCPACREEARALASMQATLRTDVGQDHVTGAELVAYATGVLSGRGAVHRVRRHLGDCPPCRERLNRLRQDSDARPAPVVESATPVPAATDRRWRKVGLAAAIVLAVVLIGVVAVKIPGWRPQVAPAIDPERDANVVFMPPTRGDAARRVLRGPGPWSIRLVLPSTAPAGPYRLTIGREGVAPRFEDTVLSGNEGAFPVDIPPLEGSGEYLLRLVPLADVDAGPYDYPFEVGPDERAP